MRLSVSTGFSYTRPFQETLDIIVAAGGESAELLLNQALVDVPSDTLKHALASRGLRVGSIHSPLECVAFPRRWNEEECIARAVRLAGVVDAGVVVSHMVFGEDFEADGFSLDEKHRRSILRVKGVAGVAVTTENMPVQAGLSFTTST